MENRHCPDFNGAYPPYRAHLSQTNVPPFNSWLSWLHLHIFFYESHSPQKSDTVSSFLCSAASSPAQGGEFGYFIHSWRDFMVRRFKLIAQSLWKVIPQPVFIIIFYRYLVLLSIFPFFPPSSYASENPIKSKNRCCTYSIALSSSTESSAKTVSSQVGPAHPTSFAT